MGSSTPRRFVIVPARAAYEAEHCWQCPNLRTRDLGYAEHEDTCDHDSLDMPQVPDDGIPDWCPIKHEESHASINNS